MKHSAALFLILGSVIFRAPCVKAETDVAKMNGFINRLMAKMTLEEKLGQLGQATAEKLASGPVGIPTLKDDIVKARVGSVLNAFGPELTRELQTLAVEKTRMKIPLMFALDVIHGYQTMFPIPLGESASWDLALMEATAAVAAREAAADGLNWTFAPMVDISRDPRWGRVMEGAGEDPWLGAKVAAARVRGFQGKEIGALDRVIATAKHFGAYGAVKAGREYHSADVSLLEMRETYLPPFKAAVDAGVASFMPSLNENAGIPSTMNTWLLRDVLRDEWRFKGFLVTDWDAITDMVRMGAAADQAEAALKAFNAGNDIDMMGGAFVKHLPALIKEGRVKPSAVDAAVRRVLEIKYKLGLFDDPFRFIDKDRPAKVMLAREHRDLAREAARRSMVLLKNNGVLPLKRSGTIALIGPYVEERFSLMGFWAGVGDGNKVVPLLDGMRAVVGDKAQLVHALGANLLDDKRLIDYANTRNAIIKGDGYNYVPDPRSADELLREAVKTAKRADVIVAALGEAAGLVGESASRSQIRLPANQLALLAALKETGKPVVLLLFNGRPLALETESALADAILVAWMPGSEGGPAAADVLMGDYNPAGKLTMTFPRNEGQIPIFYSEKSNGRPLEGEFSPFKSLYLDVANTPLYPFGWGLSYTKFTYSGVKLKPTKLKRTERLKVSVEVSNAGDFDGEEVVQLYIRDVAAAVTRPLKQLRGFEKIHLKKGESKSVVFELGPDDLKFYDHNLKWTVEPGAFQVFVGGNSADVVQAEFTLL